MPIGGIGLNPAGGITPGRPASQTAGGNQVGSDFASMLKDALSDVNNKLQSADAAAAQLATGDAQSLHGVVLATEQANLALQFTMAVRTKILDAYNEIMRMSV